LVCLETTGFHTESTFSAGFAGAGFAGAGFGVVAAGAGFLVGAAVVE
jgi:hypothetical protein